MSNPWSKLFGPSSGCPSFEDLIASLEGRHGAAAQRVSQVHVAGCSYCATELDLFREFDAPQSRPGEAANVRAIVERLTKHSPVRAIAWWRYLWNWKILAPASIALASAALMFTIWTPSPRRSPDFSGEESVFRSSRIVVVSPAAEVHESPRVFSWRPVEGAASYRIRLFEVDNTDLWSVSVAGPKADLPAYISSRLIAPKKVHWQVAAVDARGRVIADSGVQSITITR